MLLRPAPFQTPSLAGLAVLGLVLAILLKRLSLYFARRQFKKEHGCKPPQARYPLKDPFLGIDLMLENIKLAKELRFLQTSQSRFQRLGANTYTSKHLLRPIIHTCEPENVKTILTLRFKDFGISNRQRNFKPLLGFGIFNADGEQWTHSRHMIRPNFARDQVADLAAFERLIPSLFKLIPRDGSPVDLQDLFFRFTIDSATDFLFGRSVDSLKCSNSSDAGFAEYFKIAQDDAVSRGRLDRLYPLLGKNKKAEEAIKLCHQYVDQFVDAAVEYRKTHDLEKAATEEKYVFLHELAKSTSDKKRLRDELVNVLLAGRDTTASLLSNMFFEIAKRPHVWAKIRAEVAELNGELPTYERLRNLKYVKYCLNESLRIHPVVPSNGRTAVRDSVLPLGGGPDGKSPLFVPKGTLVAYSSYTMHRRTDYYGPDAHEFKPERWETLRPGWEYLPFNGGPRICLGQQYALTEASYVTARLAQEFEKLESHDPGPWKENLTLTCCSANGAKVVMTPIEGGATP